MTSMKNKTMESNSHLSVRTSVTKPNSGKTNKENIKQIVEKVQKSYSQYEKGELDEKSFRNVIVNDLKISSNKFDEILKSAKHDNKNFKTIISSLGIFDKPTAYYPTFTQEDLKNSTNKKFPRYVKDKENYSIKSPTHTSNAFYSTSDTCSSGSESLGGMNSLKEYVNKFVQGYINTKDFEKVLKEKNVNPQIEEINKYIRNAGSGPVNHKELMRSVMKYRNDNFANDPNKISHNFRNLNNFDHGQFNDNSDGVIVMARDGKDPLVLKKRKKVENNPNLVSKKEVFDWTLNERETIHDNKENFNTEKPTKKNKFVIQGRVYHKENDLNVMLNPKKKNNPHPVTENILGWDENLPVRKNYSVDMKNERPTTFRRRDPNFSFSKENRIEDPPKKAIKIVNANLFESEDNTLKYKGVK